ncbi:MAG TPA: efflux RND transporter periplasmic adaptor subunit [Caulobacteraceae bacterium]
MWLALAAAVALAAFGIWSRSHSVSSLKTEADDAAIPRVQLVAPTAAPAQRTLVLPGSIDAWYQAPIFGQVSGYILHWYKDYGAPVNKGALLATISAPAVDAQYQAAKADLATTQAQYQLAVVTAQRWAALSGTQAVAQEDVDIKKANAVALKAQVAAAQQNVARYGALVAFERLVAPFDGVVTARNTDIGDYVNAAGGDATLRVNATPLFIVADIHAMRVFVSVPQEYSTFLAPGLQATLTLPQSPEKQIPAKVLTTANAVRPESRTVVTELILPNPNHTYWPGTYVDVHFTFPGDPGVLIVPAQALLFRASGMQVALVRSDNRIHLQDVTLGRNLGSDVEIRSGLTQSDRFVANPSLGLLEGQQVKIVQPVKGYQPAQRGPPPQPPASPSRPATPPPFSANAAKERAAATEPGSGTPP